MNVGRVIPPERVPMEEPMRNVEATFRNRINKL